MHIPGQLKSFTYLGSKYSILPWLLPLLPKDRHHYVSVCGGSGVDLLNQPPSPIETLNDVNGNVVNFFRVLRENKDALIQALEFTPHSRQEYEAAWHNPDDSPLERARKFFVRTEQSFFATGAQNQLKGWLASTKESRRGISQSTHKFLKGVHNLEYVYRRLRNVQLENRDFGWILTAYDGPGTLFYSDVPYDSGKRSGKNDYEFDFTDEDHRRHRDAASNVTGRIAISGYDTAFMKQLYKDFYFYEGPEQKNNYRKVSKAKECLWTNYEVQKVVKTSLFE